MCFDCDEGRQQILKCEGCLKKLVEIAKGREERAKKFGEDPGQRLPAILPGFLLNFCNSTPTAIEAIGKFRNTKLSIISVKPNATFKPLRYKQL